MNNVIEIAGTEFEREMRTVTRPVLMHFYTSWSAECRILEQTLETLAEELGGELDFRKANLDNHPELARRYRITEVPSLVLFDHGVSIAGFAGTTPLAELKPHLEGLLADYAPPRARGK